MTRTGAAIAGLVLLAQAAGADVPGTLSMDMTTLPGEDYTAALAIARDAGASVTSLSLAWDEFEPEPGVYGPVTDWPAIAGAYYPGEDMALTLTFSVIDTVKDRRPADLRALAWDDPVVVARFADHLAAVLSRLEPVDLRAIAIGNEVDGLLNGPEERAAFARFLKLAIDRARALRPGIPVAAKLTAAGLRADPAGWQEVMAAGDALFLTYYPLGPDFAALPPEQPLTDLPAFTALADGKPLYLLEAGYPSEGCGSSDAAQAVFVATLFTAWADAGSDAVPLISLSWLTDLTDAEARDYAGYYGVAEPCFESYLGSIGLRDDEGKPKQALRWLSGG